MSAADEILADLPLDQLAAQLGTDPSTAEQAVRTALPALFGGLQANVSDSPQGSVSLAEALTQHTDPQFFEGGVNLDDVDTSDGQAIVNHIFANSPDQAQVLQASSMSGGLLQKLLPILAPIVMAYIAKKLGMGTQASTQQQSRDSGMGGLGDLLGPILGGLFGGSGAGTGQASGSSGSGGMGGFGDILGQILAGQTPKTQQAPVETHDDGQWNQPPTGGGSSGSFGNAGGDSSDGGLTMPTVDEDPRDSGNRQQQSSDGVGDILGGLFGR